MKLKRGCEYMITDRVSNEYLVVKVINEWYAYYETELLEENGVKRNEEYQIRKDCEYMTNHKDIFIYPITDDTNFVRRNIPHILELQHIALIAAKRDGGKWFKELANELLQLGYKPPGVNAYDEA